MDQKRASALRTAGRLLESSQNHGAAKVSALGLDRLTKDRPSTSNIGTPSLIAAAKQLAADLKVPSTDHAGQST